MNTKDKAMGIYRGIEEQARAIHDDTLGSPHCKKCSNAEYYKHDVEGTSVHCKTSNPMHCPHVYEVIGQLANDLEVALQEINFD